MNWALEYKKTRESDVARKNVDEFKIVKERRGAPLVEMVGNWQNGGKDVLRDFTNCKLLLIIRLQ